MVVEPVLAGAVVLVFVIQGSIWINFTFPYVQGLVASFVTDMIVSAIQMGATIDYAIVFSGYYKELRRTLPRYESLCGAYENSIHTIMTSGLILILVTAILGKFCPTQSIAQVCTSIALGSLSAVLLILFILPGLLACFDRLIIRQE